MKQGNKKYVDYLKQKQYTTDLNIGYSISSTI